MTDVVLVFLYLKKEGTMTLNTPKSKLDKIAWLNKQEEIAKFSKLQLQKFLYFYEMFQYVDGNDYDFSSLKAYKNGPVFSNFYGDITYREEEISDYLRSAKEDNTTNELNARTSKFLIETMTDSELSDLTHEFDMWKVHKDKISANVQQIPMSEEDITDDDIDLIEFIRSSEPAFKYEVLMVGDKRFVCSKEDFEHLSDKHLELLDSLSSREELMNPVYIELDTDGRLLID